MTDEAWKAAKKDGIDRDVLKVFFAGVKPDKDGVRSRTFSELEEYASERTTSVGDKLEDYQSTVKGKLEARELIASDGAIAMVPAWFSASSLSLAFWALCCIPTLRTPTSVPL